MAIAKPMKGTVLRSMRSGHTVLAFWIAATAGGSAWAGATTVYKCFDRNLSVVYTDVPCVGEQMNIRAGDADPVAVAELQRERQAIAASAAQRITDTRRAALDRAAAAQYLYRPAEGMEGAPGVDYDVPYGYAYFPSNRVRRPRSPVAHATPRQRTVPAIPAVPRMKG